MAHNFTQKLSIPPQTPSVIYFEATSGFIVLNTELLFDITTTCRDTDKYQNPLLCASDILFGLVQNKCEIFFPCYCI